MPAALTLALGALALVLANRLLLRRAARSDSGKVVQQLGMLALTAVLVVAVVLSLPIDGAQKGQLLSLLGLLLSAAIALASTTFLGNAIAGLMIRAVGGFRIGDFIEVGDHFGRVSERGILHVEIQTDARDLVTVPNLHIVSNPVKVVRADGTVVSADVSLGYDVDHVRAEGLLLEAAEAAGLSDPFVRVMELRDHAVCYRASGFLKDVKQLITARSRLHAHVLDALHGDGVEIVSPSFMNQRALAPGQRVLSDPAERPAEPRAEAEAGPEKLVFDKAESAALREDLQATRERLTAARGRLADAAEGSGDAQERDRITHQVERLDRQLARIEAVLAEPPEGD